MSMYLIQEVRGGFVVVNCRNGAVESEVYANLACAQDFMALLMDADDYCAAAHAGGVL